MEETRQKRKAIRNKKGNSINWRKGSRKRRRSWRRAKLADENRTVRDDDEFGSQMRSKSYVTLKRDYCLDRETLFLFLFFSLSPFNTRKSIDVSAVIIISPHSHKIHCWKWMDGGSLAWLTPSANTPTRRKKKEKDRLGGDLIRYFNYSWTTATVVTWATWLFRHAAPAHSYPHPLQHS